jgi:hypothetical protein
MHRFDYPFKGDLPGVHVSECVPVTSKTRRPRQDMGCSTIAKKIDYHKKFFIFDPVEFET